MVKKNRARKNVEVSINIELSTKINLEPASILITYPIERIINSK